MVNITERLLSCSEEEKIIETTKKDFYIETKQVADFAKDLTINKTGKVDSSQNINLSSQIAWRVSKIFVKQWDQVQAWAIIARMEDNIANYTFALEMAQNALGKVKINYETTENQLNKAVSDLKINLSNLKIDEYNSSSSLELEKIDNTAKKMTIDYENLKISNIQTIEGFKNSLSKDLISFNIFIDNIILFSDNILWVTVKNSNNNNTFEIYLWAKNSSQKRETEDLLRSLIDYKNNKLQEIDYSFEWSVWFDQNLLIVEQWYDIISNLLTNLNDTLDNSVISLWNLSDTTISWYKTSISTYWITFNTNNSWFVWTKNSINSFLETYKNSEESLKKQIELLLDDKKIYIKSLDTRLEIDESTLQEAISNKALTLKHLDASITDARIGYKQALNNYNKLIIKSPITWVVGKIWIDVWQEVSPWIPLFEISNNSRKQITISFSKDDLQFINVWDIVTIKNNWNSFVGSIYSISNIADNNLKFPVQIDFNDNLNFVWDIVNVIVPFKTNKILLPINIIEIDNSWKWIINILVNSEIVEKNLTLWKFYWDKVEILDTINSGLEIITTNVSNFDGNKFILKIK